MVHQPPYVVVFYDATLPVQRRAVSGVLRYANSFGRWFVSLNEAHSKASVPANCRGILACAPPPKQFHALRRLNLPLVLINLARLENEDLSLALTMPHVRSDSRAFGVQAADFFLSRAERRTFVYVGTDPAPVWDVERGEAFAARIRSAGFEPRVYKPLASAASPTKNAVHLQDWLKRLPRPLAIFAANDERARQVLTACQLADMTVPYEAEVLGVDDDEWLCESTRPRLSSIPFRSEEGGFHAAQILDNLMRQRDDPAHPVPVLERMIPPSAVVERESTSDLQLSDPIAGRALAFIRQNKGLNIRVQDVADAVGCNPNRLESRFKKELGTSIINEITRTRLNTVLHLIEETKLPFQEIAAHCGFTNASTLCRIIKNTTGKTMTELRR